MKNYCVTVNGTKYEVEVELVSEEAVVSSEPKAAVVATPQGTGETVRAPIPGMILNTQVAAGARVKAGQILMVLEAMKMENEIMAPRDGVVKELYVKSGDAVELDAPLCLMAN